MGGPVMGGSLTTSAGPARAADGTAGVLLCQGPWYDLIAEGKKTVEGRPARLDKYERWLGQKITVQKDAPGSLESVTARVTSVTHYPTLEEYLAAHWQEAAPHAGSLEEARKLYLDIIMVSRGREVDTWEAGFVVHVFSEARVDLRGGIVALGIELL